MDLHALLPVVPHPVENRLPPVSGHNTGVCKLDTMLAARPAHVLLPSSISQVHQQSLFRPFKGHQPGTLFLQQLLKLRVTFMIS